MKSEKQTPDDALQEALQENIQGSGRAGKFIARFASAWLKTRTSNLAEIANAFESHLRRIGRILNAKFPDYRGEEVKLDLETDVTQCLILARFNGLSAFRGR